MKCPFCFKINSFVKDSRESEDGLTIRRRRYCEECGRRFTTFERIQSRELFVIKKSGAKKNFDREKIQKSITTALRKRNIPEETVNDLINLIIMELESNNLREIPTEKIGELIMRELAQIDQVAYIRFASVYKDFSSSKDFVKFVSKINK